MKYAFQDRKSALKAALWEIGYVGYTDNGISEVENVYSDIDRFLKINDDARIEIQKDILRGRTFAYLKNGESGYRKMMPNLVRMSENEVDVYDVPNPWTGIEKKRRITKVCIESGSEDTYRAWVVHPLTNEATLILDDETMLR